jgi:hypothetical protein
MQFSYSYVLKIVQIKQIQDGKKTLENSTVQIPPLVKREKFLLVFTTQDSREIGKNMRKLILVYDPKMTLNREIV